MDRKEAHAARYAHVGRLEQSGIQHKDAQQSEEIFNKKHSAKNRKG